MSSVQATARPPFSTTTTSSQPSNSCRSEPDVYRCSTMWRSYSQTSGTATTTRPPGLTTRRSSSDTVRRIGDVVEGLDARDAVVAAVGTRQELGRDDVGHAVAVVDVEPDDAHAGRDEVVVRTAAAEHVEDDAARLGEPRQRGPQVVQQPPQMQIVELPRPRMPARAAGGAQGCARAHGDLTWRSECRACCAKPTTRPAGRPRARPRRQSLVATGRRSSCARIKRMASRASRATNGAIAQSRRQRCLAYIRPWPKA